MVSEWSEEDVLAWLREEGLESVIDVFKSNNIDGEELLSLTKDTLSSELHIGKITAHITQYWHSCLIPRCRLWMSALCTCLSLYGLGGDHVSNTTGMTSVLLQLMS